MSNPYEYTNWEMHGNDVHIHPLIVCFSLFINNLHAFHQSLYMRSVNKVTSFYFFYQNFNMVLFILFLWLFPIGGVLFVTREAQEAQQY